MTRDEDVVAIVAEALRSATFRWDDPDIERKAAEVAVDALGDWIRTDQEHRAAWVHACFFGEHSDGSGADE